MAIQPKKITKNDLIKETARKLDKSSKEVKQVIDTFIDEISVELKNENHIAIKGFISKLQVQPTNRTQFFNPKTREVVKAKRNKRISISISESFRDKVCE